MNGDSVVGLLVMLFILLGALAALLGGAGPSAGRGRSYVDQRDEDAPKLPRTPPKPYNPDDDKTPFR